MLRDPVSREHLIERNAQLRAAAFADWTVRSPAEWATTVRRLPGKHGVGVPFSFDYAPYQLAMFLALFDPSLQEVIFQLFSRGGKSEVVLNAVGYWIHEAPASIFVMWPTLGQAKKWSKDQLQRELIDPTPELTALIGDGAGRRRSDNTLLHKLFDGGLIDMVGANSPGDIRRAKGNRLYADEIDAIVEIQSDEGDQLKQFKGRGDEYPDTSEVYCSYPSLRDRSRIEAKLLKSDLQQWFVSCLLCGGEPFIMHRHGGDPFADRKKRSRLLYDANHVKDARIECPNCKGHLDDAQRILMARGGDPKKPRFDLWQPTRPFEGKRGFHANAFLWPHALDPRKYPGGFLQLLAQEELDVEKSENPERSRRVMVNRRDAETYQSASDVKPDHTRLFLRREAWAGLDPEGHPLPWDASLPVPAGVLCVVFFCDVQDDRLEVFLEGRGENHQVWQLGYHVIKGGKGCALAKPNEGVWAKLDRLIDQTTFLHPSGRTLPILGGLVDAGDKRDHVFAFTRPRKRRKIFASRGDTELCRPIVEKRARKEGDFRTPVWVLGTHAAKEVIYLRLDQDAPLSTGYRHYPVAPWCSEHFFAMLTAENSEDRQARDGEWYKWFGCAKGVRNESLDGAVGCEAATRILKPKWEKLAALYVLPKPGESPAASEAKPEPTATPPRRKFVQTLGKRGGKGFVTGWKGDRRL